MTAKKTRISPRGVFVTAFSILAFVLVINYSDAAIDSVRHALYVCAQTVIPALFPFMVISKVLEVIT